MNKCAPRFSSMSADKPSWTDEAEVASEESATEVSREECELPASADTATSGMATEASLALGQAGVAQPSERLIFHSQPLNSRSEKVRALRTGLMLRVEPGSGTNVVAILSPNPGDGRSQLAAELAIAFSQLGQPTLLVDADLRKPMQHVLFSADNECGLAEAIRLEGSPLYHTVQGCPDLLLLTSGCGPSNALDLFSDPAFDALVDAWRKQFRFVVIDTPPVSRYSDGLAVAASVGRALAVSRAHHTRFTELKEMLRQLYAAQTRLLGSVINHF
jgi:protein-tyrosine kinase